MDGYVVDRTAVEATAEALRSGGTALEGTIDPPPGPEAGECAAGFALVLALLADSMAGVAEGLDVVAAAAMGSVADYQGAEQAGIGFVDGVDGGGG